MGHVTYHSKAFFIVNNNEHHYHCYSYVVMSTITAGLIILEHLFDLNLEVKFRISSISPKNWVLPQKSMRRLAFFRWRSTSNLKKLTLDSESALSITSKNLVSPRNSKIKCFQLFFWRSTSNLKTKTSDFVSVPSMIFVTQFLIRAFGGLTSFFCHMKIFSKETSTH